MTQRNESHESYAATSLPALAAAINQAAARATSLIDFLQHWLQIIGETWPDVRSAAAYLYKGESLHLAAQYPLGAPPISPPDDDSAAARAASEHTVITPDDHESVARWGFPLIQGTAVIGAYQITLPVTADTVHTSGSALAGLQDVIALATARFLAPSPPGDDGEDIKPLLAVLDQIARQSGFDANSAETFNAICRNLTLTPNILHAAIIAFDSTKSAHFVLSEHPVRLDLPASQPLTGATIRDYVQDNPTSSFLKSQAELTQLLGDPQATLITQPGQRVAFVPLRVQNEHMGALLLTTENTGDAFSQSEIYVTEAIAAQIALSLLNTALSKSIRYRTEQLEHITAFGRLVTSTFDETEILGNVADTVPKLIDCDHVSVVLYAGEQPQMHMFDLDPDRTPEAVAVSAGGSSVEEIVRSYTPIAVTDLTRSTYTDHKRMAQRGFRSMITVPLFASQKPLGALSIAHRQPDVYTQTDLTLLRQIGTQVAIALDNAALYHSAQQRAIYEEALSEITSRLQQQSDLRVMLEQTMHDLGRTLGARRARVRLQIGPHDDEVES